MSNLPKQPIFCEAILTFGGSVSSANYNLWRSISLLILLVFTEISMKSPLFIISCISVPKFLRLTGFWGFGVLGFLPSELVARQRRRKTASRTRTVFIHFIFWQILAEWSCPGHRWNIYGGEIWPDEILQLSWLNVSMMHFNFSFLCRIIQININAWLNKLVYT